LLHSLSFSVRRPLSGYDMVVPMEEEQNKCKRCGQCMSVCPIYQTTFREADVARGKLALLESVETGATDWSSRLEEIISRCLLCGACREVCANQVETTRIMQRHRQHFFEAKKKRDHRSGILVGAMQGDPGARGLLKGGALVQALMCKKIPESSGLHLRFPLSFFTQRETVPSIAWTPFLDTVQTEANTVDNPRGARIGLFVGCGANYLFPEAARALVRILKRLGINLIVPENQTCCGLPAYVSGDMDKARQLASKNIEAFESLDLDAVLTLCASCGSHLDGLSSLFGQDPTRRDTAASLASRHMDAMTFLVDHLDIVKYLKTLKPAQGPQRSEILKAAYHDPCHLRIEQAESSAPRRLLGSLPGVQLMEPSHPGRCCGHGGNFNLSHFSLSINILERRMEDFKKVQPDRIVTGCTGCLLQFSEGISRYGLKGRVEACHPLVLVEQAIAFCRTPTQRQKGRRGPQTQNTDPVQ
jgi:glycolate oxidase iron-sulfur subunit